MPYFMVWRATYGPYGAARDGRAWLGGSGSAHRGRVVHGPSPFGRCDDDGPVRKVRVVHCGPAGAVSGGGNVDRGAERRGLAGEVLCGNGGEVTKLWQGR